MDRHRYTGRGKGSGLVGCKTEKEILMISCPCVEGGGSVRQCHRHIEIDK